MLLRFTRLSLFLSALSLLLGCAAHTELGSSARPNIVLIMGDDIGFSDISCYGSEIQTPNLDRLAAQGMRFRSFYNMAKCNPTRSSLLTGLYGGGNGAVHIAQLAKQAGYHCIMSGKEHFDAWVPEYCKAEEVFDHSFYFWATTEYFLPPRGEFERPFFLEGKELSAEEIQYQQSPMYKTDFITDYALNWLDEAFEANDDPFFLYLPYHAAHYPLQARPEDIAKYRGQYLAGWDSLRLARYARMQALGVLPPNTQLSAPEGNLNQRRGPLVPAYTDYTPWAEMSEAQQDSLDLEMAVFAAMVDRMDQNIGRVLDKLEAAGKLENTLILFLVDNGSCPFYANKIPEVQPGPADSYWSLRAAWANLGNTPFRQYKQCGHEGGSHTPFIAYWPGQISANQITDHIGHVVDIAPTLLDIWGTSYPDSIQGYPTLPLQGTSLLPAFKGKEAESDAFFISGMKPFRMYRQGKYKIARLNNGPWELYDMEADPAETEDLAEAQPGVVAELVEAYEQRKEEIKIK